MKEIGNKLKELRGNKSMTEVSQQTGISEKSLYAYENGTRIPSDEKKFILANYFNTTIEFLFFEHFVNK